MVGDCLAARSAHRHRTNMEFVVLLSRGAHILALQETRGTSCDFTEFVDFLPGWATYGSFVRGGAAGRVVFLVSPALQALYSDFSVMTIVPGRIATLRLRGGTSAPLDVINVHLVQNERTPPRRQMRMLQESITPLREAVSLVIGDFNVSAPGECRLDMRTGRLHVDTSPLVDALGDALADMHEVVAQGYSRVQCRDGRPQLLSRLDRLFTNSPTSSLVGGCAFAHYHVGVLDRALPSDHAPLEGRFLPPRTAGRFRVPRWALQHPLYAERLSEAADAILTADLEPAEALRQLSHVARAVVVEIRRCRIPVGSRAFAWQAHWLSAARSCWGRRDKEGLMRAVEECSAP